MLARIAAFIAAAFNALGKATKWSFDVLWATARLPFELISTRPPAPNYTPTVEKSDVLDEYHQARAQQHQAAVHSLNRGGIETLLDYCRAHRDDRVSMRLPKDLPPTVLASLISMSDAELRTLSKAGIGQVRKFMSGKPHGIHGVPSVADAPVPSFASEAPPKGMTEHERMQWRIKARMLRERQEPFKAPAMR